MSFPENLKLGESMRTHLAQMEENNEETLKAIVEQMLKVIQDDGLIFSAGTGHSLALVLETFYRAGGLACVYPLYHAALLPFEGGLTSTLFERTEGLARLLIAQANPSPKDMAFIFSNSGVNPVPVELGQELKEAGTTVVGVVSLTHLQQAPKRADYKLNEVADLVLDTGVPYGDASLQINGASTAPLSSLCCVYLWNLLLGKLAKLAQKKGVELPLWRSANVQNGVAQNEALMDRYRARIPYL
ncbi:MAG: sugar isomerase domain-containing protein [Anaerolineales bacterium]